MVLTLISNLLSSLIDKLSKPLYSFMFSAKTFLKTYGAVGVSVYGGLTAISISSFYLALRTGKVDNMITSPLEKILGEQSELVQNIKRQLGEVGNNDRPPTTTAVSNDLLQSSNNKASDFHWAREGAYLGIATLLDSLVLPIKLVVCLPIAKYMLKRRGR